MLNSAMLKMLGINVQDIERQVAPYLQQANAVVCQLQQQLNRIEENQRAILARLENPGAIAAPKIESENHA